ncbi:MAG: hypothetical protein M4579_001644 [Chaenotheca gracillima]|nr:MAG: hypothetical protein M4579_001644 [Chaenotheca gracillima]
MAVTTGYSSKVEDSTTVSSPTSFQSSSLSKDPTMDRDSSPPGRREWRFYAAFVTLCVCNLVCALDATSLSVALPTIARGINASAIEAFWCGTSFLLASTVFQPVYAQFSNAFGRKPMILFALLLFTVGAIVAALAKNTTTMLVGRTIQGVGGGGLVALTYVIVTDLVTLRERGKWFGLITMQWAIGTVTGPVIGGAFAEKVTWRWIFWINLPFCGLAFVMIPLFLRLKSQNMSMASRIGQVDWIGCVLFVASITSFLIPLSWGGIMYSWSSWHTLVPLLLGVAGMIGFIVYSIYLSPQPLIPGTIFKSASAVVNYFGTVIHGTILWSTLYYLPLYYQVAQGLSPILSGVALFPQSFTVAPSAVVVGILVTKTGSYKLSIWVGWALTTFGMGLLVLPTQYTHTAAWVFINLVSGLGLGILYPSMSFAVQATASNKDLPVAAAMFSFFRAFGQALGVTIGGVVFQNSVRRKLEAYPDLAGRADEYSKDATSLVEMIKALPPSQDEQRQQFIQAYVDALHVVWIVMCALAAVAMIASAWTKSYSLDRALETDQGWVDSDERKSDKDSSVGKA